MEMPRSCFTARDYLHGRYWAKRTLYLRVVAAAVEPLLGQTHRLQVSRSAGSLATGWSFPSPFLRPKTCNHIRPFSPRFQQVEYLGNSTMRPILAFVALHPPPSAAPSHAPPSVRLYPALPPQLFQASRLAPARCNFRPVDAARSECAAFDLGGFAPLEALARDVAGDGAGVGGAPDEGERAEEEGAGRFATPHYNNAIAADACFAAHRAILYAHTQAFPAARGAAVGYPPPFPSSIPQPHSCSSCEQSGCCCAFVMWGISGFEECTECAVRCRASTSLRMLFTLLASVAGLTSTLFPHCLSTLQVLYRVWARQRGLLNAPDSISGFLFSMLLAYLSQPRPDLRAPPSPPPDVCTPRPYGNIDLCPDTTVLSEH